MSITTSRAISLLAASSSLILVTSLAASADTGSRRCSGDVCAIKDVSGSTTVLYAAASGQSFFGHLHLSNGANSQTRWWYRGGLNGPSHWQVQERTQRGPWCITAWDVRGYRRGTVCL